MERPGEGEKFKAKIDRISSSGNGIIEFETDQHINVGPVVDDAVGEKITAIVNNTDGVFAYCLTESVRVDEYESKLLRMSSKNRSGATFCPKCGSIMYPNKNRIRECSSCGFEEYNTGFENLDETNLNKKSRSDIPSTDNNSVKTSTSTKETTGNESDIHELRQKAMQNSTNNVPDNAITYDQQKEQYNRSEEVREYVMARADGTCEGCGEPAPFTSKTGEPYLHAHHIYELSEGGSDTPDTVIALCPNCHYRVHHGNDGEEYNQELSSKIQKLENG